VGLTHAATVEVDTSLDAELSSWLSAAESLNAQVDPAIVVRPPPEEKRISSPSTVQEGGPERKRKPNMTKSSKDGKTLAPYDPFGVADRFERKLAKRHAKRQDIVNEENRKDYCRKKAAREAERLAVEARERAEEARERGEAPAGTGSVLIQLDTELDISALTQADHEALLDMEIEAQEDLEDETLDNAEAETDAEEAAFDGAEMEAEFQHDADESADAEAEAEMEEAMEAEDAALVEAGEDGPVIRASSKILLPTAHVSYNRMPSEELYSNKDSRAVFKRRAHGQQVSRALKKFQSSGGNAVVNGVTKTPCGKEITDTGLFAAVVKKNLDATVEAANPFPPTVVDDNVNAIHALPIVPQFREEGGVDEYGDEK